MDIVSFLGLDFSDRIPEYPEPSVSYHLRVVPLPPLLGIGFEPLGKGLGGSRAEDLELLPSRYGPPRNDDIGAESGRYCPGSGDLYEIPPGDTFGLLLFCHFIFLLYHLILPLC